MNCLNQLIPQKYFHFRVWIGSQGPIIGEVVDPEMKVEYSLGADNVEGIEKLGTYYNGALKDTLCAYLSYTKLLLREMSVID